MDIEYRAAQPEVQVQRMAEPVVQLEQSGQPKVSVVQAEPKVIVKKGQQTEGIAGMTGETIVGQEVVRARGETLGTITNLVADKQSNRILAVVDLTDAAAGQDQVIVVPLRRIQLVEGTLRWNPSTQQLKQASAYNKGQYQPLALDVPVGEFAMFGDAPASQSSSKPTTQK